jgi:predicted  nucleic acid-binding Zn-ribbon protein
MDSKDLHVHTVELEFIKSFLPMVMQAFEDGAVFFATDLQHVTFKHTEKFDFPGLDVGNEFSSSGLSARIIQNRQPMVFEIPREVYGKRVYALGGPVWNDTDSEVIGSWAIGAPREHKIVQAFETFAPVIANMLPEGGMLCLSTAEKFAKRQGSEKFDMPDIQIGTSVRAGSTQDIAFKQKKLITQEIDEALYGVPISSTTAPLIDENTGAVLGGFSVILPRKLAKDLKALANSLDEGLTGVSASIQQITSATNDVSGNQSHLHAEISKVKGQLDNINNVMRFIKEIADETNMLGLNAAIEAARVGEAGRGFGVVAEEIRKLSEASKKTVIEIKELTQQIEESINATAGASESTLAVTEETSAAVQEVNATIEEMTSLANTLTETAASL